MNLPITKSTETKQFASVAKATAHSNTTNSDPPKVTANIYTFDMIAKQVTHRWLFESQHRVCLFILDSVDTTNSTTSDDLTIETYH